MRCLFPLLIVGCAADSSPPSPPAPAAENVNGVADAPPRSVQDTIARVADRFDVPGIAVASIRQGQVAWISTHGAAATDRSVDPDTVFNVASLTKPIFATLVMHQVAAGHFSLDAPLSQHWVDPDVTDDPRHQTLTARLALSHQSGLPNWRGKKPLAFSFDPGARHEYSGEGFEYVRRALERATGRTLPELMQESVLVPAEMESTQFGWSETLANRIATGYREDGAAFDMGYLRNRGPNAAANTFTTIRDMARFAAWFARGADLPKDAYAELLSPQAVYKNPVEFFAIGWRVIRVAGAPVVSHDGREGGLRTLMVINPKTEDGLVILTNSSNGELVTREIIAAALPDGPALNAQTDRDVWLFFVAQPPPAQAAMLQFIARSPSFTAKVLHAAATRLADSGVLTEAQVVTAQRHTNRIVLAHHEGRLDAEALAPQLALLDTDPGAEVQMLERFNVVQANAWLAGLEGLLGTP
ncbi:MAG: serine hydrolase domain-containing protein [Myxococcota bacterium]